MNVLSTVCLFCLVELSQTIPEDGSPVCLGQVLQYTCSSTESSLFWQLGGGLPVEFSSHATVNLSLNIGEFVAVLTASNGSFLSSTLTNAMITLGYNGQQVSCYGGISVEVLYIDIVKTGNHACTVIFNVNKVAFKVYR